MRAGAAIAATGFRVLLARRALWPWVVATWTVYLTVFVVLIWQFVPGGLAWLSGRWTPPKVWWLLVIWWVVAVVVSVLALVMVVVSTSILASILASPLLDRISQRIEDEWEPSHAEPFALGAVVRDVAVGIAHTVLNLVVFGLLMIGIAALNFLPVVGSAAAAGFGFALGATTISLESADYALSRRRLRWRQKVALVRKSRGLMMGFGAVGALLTTVPLVNIVIAPALVVGGTLVVLALEREGTLVR